MPRESGVGTVFGPADFQKTPVTFGVVLAVVVPIAMAAAGVSIYLFGELRDQGRALRDEIIDASKKREDFTNKIATLAVDVEKGNSELKQRLVELEEARKTEKTLAVELGDKLLHAQPIAIAEAIRELQKKQASALREERPQPVGAP